MDTSYYNISGSILLISIGIIAVISFLFYKECNKHIRSLYFRPIHIFLLSYLVVFFQTPIDILMGYKTDYYQVGQIGLMPESVRLADLGIIVFLFGYISSKTKIKTISDRPKRSIVAPVGVFKFLTSAFLISIYILVPTEILRGGYGFALQNTFYNYLSSWTSVFFCAFFIQDTINKRAANQGKYWTLKEYIMSVGKWQNINMLLYLVMILNIGDRGPLITVTLIYYISYVSVSGICPPKRVLVIGMLAGILFVSFLGFTKGFRNNDTIMERISVTWKANVYNDVQESVMPATQELAGSYRCLSYSVEDIKKNGNYGYGKYQMGYLLSFIPFATSVFGLSDPTSTYISHLIQGNFLTYGNGSSIIADFYLDGGILGVLLGMYLFGFFVRRFEISLFVDKKISLLLFCIAFYFSIHFVEIARQSSLLYFKYSIWLAFILYLYQTIFKSYQSKK